MKHLSLLFFFLLSFLTRAHAARPNVLFILVDDLRPELGCYGAPVQTPNIDALAARAVLFQRAYCQYPLCNPSRASLLTGLRPTTSGVLNNSGDFRKTRPELVSLPQFFKDNGYTTVGNGKVYHGGIDDAKSWTDPRPPQGPKPQGPMFLPNPSGEPTTPRKGAETAQMKRSDSRAILAGDGEAHADYRTTDAAILALQRLKDQPFFLTCGLLKPHAELAAPQRFYDLYPPEKLTLPDDFAAFPTPPKGFPAAALTQQNIDLFWNREANAAEAKLMIQAYRASVSWMDWNVGRLMKALDEAGLREKTIVVLWGDHGYHLGEMGKWSKHSSLFDLGTRVPLLISAPAAKGNSKASPRVVESLDLYPTLASLCGLKAPEHVEGRDISPLLDNPEAPWDHPAVTVAGTPNQLHRAIRTERWRYIHWSGPQGGKALIDEQNDPKERTNLIDDPTHAETVQKLHEQLDVLAPIPPAADKAAKPGKTADASPAPASPQAGDGIRQGDWLITSHEVIKGRTLQVNGNIIIRDGGKLTLEDATLEVLGKFSRQHQIKLEDNGTLVTTRATLGGTENKGGAPVHTVILLHGGAWEATDTTVQYSYGVNCAYDKPSRLHAVRLKAGPRPDAVIVSGQADVSLIDASFPLAISVYAKEGGKARLDLPVKTPITRTFDATNLPGVRYKLKLERFTVPDHWFVFVFDINQDRPPLELEFGDCPKVLASLLGHNIQSQLTLSSDLATPVTYGNLTMKRANGTKPNINMWNVYAGGEKSDVTIKGRGHIAELMHGGGKMTILGEGDRALSLGCTTLDLNENARLHLNNVHLGRPLNWQEDKSKGEASINGTARLTGENIGIRNVTFHTRQKGTVSLKDVTPASTHDTQEEGGKVEVVKLPAAASSPQ